MKNIGMLVRWSLTVVWCALIFLMSSLPADDLPMQDPLLSLLVHFLEYFILATLLMWAGNDGFSSPPGAAVVVTAFILSSIYGFTDELHQAFVPNRVMEALDFFVDSAGAVAACIVIPLILSLLRSRRAGREHETA